MLNIFHKIMMVIIQLHPVITTNIKANEKQGKNIQNIQIHKNNNCTIIHIQNFQTNHNAVKYIYNFLLLGFFFS